MYSPYVQSSLKINKMRSDVTTEKKEEEEEEGESEKRGKSGVVAKGIIIYSAE